MSTCFSWAKKEACKGRWLLSPAVQSVSVLILYLIIAIWPACKTLFAQTSSCLFFIPIPGLEDDPDDFHALHMSQPHTCLLNEATFRLRRQVGYCRILPDAA